MVHLAFGLRNGLEEDANRVAIEKPEVKERSMIAHSAAWPLEKKGALLAIAAGA
jgi:hypothetical protein